MRSVVRHSCADRPPRRWFGSPRVGRCECWLAERAQGPGECPFDFCPSVDHALSFVPSADLDGRAYVDLGLLVQPEMNEIQELIGASDASPVGAVSGAPSVKAPVPESLGKGEDCCVGRMPYCSKSQ